MSLCMGVQIQSRQWRPVWKKISVGLENEQILILAGTQHPATAWNNTRNMKCLLGTSDCNSHISLTMAG